MRRVEAVERDADVDAAELVLRDPLLLAAHPKKYKKLDDAPGREAGRSPRRAAGVGLRDAGQQRPRHGALAYVGPASTTSERQPERKTGSDVDVGLLLLVGLVLLDARLVQPDARLGDAAAPRLVAPRDELLVLGGPMPASCG